MYVMYLSLRLEHNQLTQRNLDEDIHVRYF